MGLASPRAASSAASSGPVQCASGTPVTAGSWQASATTAARTSALICRGPPRPRQITESFQAAVREPAPPLARRVLADAQVTGDPRVRAPHRGSQHDLRPQPVPPGSPGPADAFLQRLALRSGHGDEHSRQRHEGLPDGDYTGVIRSPRGIVPAARAAARHNEAHGRHPGVHPQLGRPAAPRPRRTALATAPPGPGHQPGRVRLCHRDPLRRRADPAVPAALRRLRPLLRVRDLLRRPGTLRQTPSCSPDHRWAHPKKPSTPPAPSTSQASDWTPDELTGPPT